MRLATFISHRRAWRAELEAALGLAVQLERANAPFTGGGSGSELPRIWPRVDRPLDLVIPGTTDAPDEMVRHFRHWHALGQFERQRLDIEVPGWPAG
jgi:hypothetical protein